MKNQLSLASTGFVNSPVGPIPILSTKWDWKDLLGMVAVRSGIRRFHYAVAPGLYAVGTPDAQSPMVVTANYKLTVDILRQELTGISSWILVLDTKGINVWCAAGKGTFGTAELVGRIASTRLSEIISHRTIILPQLAAPGVAAHEVKQLTGFSVSYGPVRAADLPTFLKTGNKATAAMRRVEFPLSERLVLIPIELVQTGKWLLAFLVLAIFLSLLSGPLSLHSVWLEWSPFPIGLLAGCIFTPLVLPWLPGRAFSVKGAIAGSLVALPWMTMVATGWQSAAGICLIIAVSAFAALNFTGATPFTSLSGVNREIRFALPALSILAGLGLLLRIVSFFSPGGVK